MNHILLSPLLMLLLMSVPVPAQGTKKIDVNLASVVELQSLPGITPQLARQIFLKRPYSKAADLHRAGLSDPIIQGIQGLIVFTRIQQEEPGGQAGDVAGIPFHDLSKCTIASEGKGLTQVVSPTEPHVAAFCLPSGWFAPDGQTLTAVGQKGVSDLATLLNKESGKQVKVVGLSSAYHDSLGKAWTKSTAALVVEGLPALEPAQSIEIISPASRYPNSSQSDNASAKEEHRIVTAVDLNKSTKEVETLVLVLPPIHPTGRHTAGGQVSTSAAPVAGPSAAASPSLLALGLTADQVRAIKGQPKSIVVLPSKTIFVYPDMKITFVNGKLSDVQ